VAVIQDTLRLNDEYSRVLRDYINNLTRAGSAARSGSDSNRLYGDSAANAARQTSGLVSELRGLAGAYLGIQGVRALTGLSDSMTSITARLDMMNDGLQTTEELNRMIYESAQRSRGSYQQTANLVAKLGTLAGDAFSSNREIIAFAEQLNKQMALSGTTTQEAQAAMLQLTQGLASGTLRGEELNSVLEQTPMIAQSIAKYMGVNTGEMRELASEGAITAGVVKSAMFAMADEINAKFEQMPMTWGQVWTSMQNTAIQALQPVLNAVNWLANNLSIIGPIVAGLAASFVVFQVAAHWTQIAAAAAGAYHFVVNLLTIGFGVLRGSTAAASAAVMTFNSALFASPITWIIMLVGVLIGLLYAGVAAFNKLTGSSVSATGIITGTLATLAAFVFNSVLVPIQRGFASFANFLGNVFDNPVASVKLLFYDMALTVLGFIQNVAQGLENLINKIPGVEVNLTSGIDILYNKIAQGAQTIRSESGWKEYIKAWDYKDLADAFSGGYNWGSNLFSGSSQTSALDYTNTPTYSQVSGIADSVKGIEKSVNMSEEDIKALVDVAERRYVNNINLTAQTPVITINGANTGRTAADRQNLANAIRDILIEQVSSGSARTTARAF
jgi:tape measure domain-containing protein